VNEGEIASMLNFSITSMTCHFAIVIVMKALSREFRVTLPWKLLYADDLVVIAETDDDLINYGLMNGRILWTIEA